MTDGFPTLNLLEGGIPIGLGAPNPGLSQNGAGGEGGFQMEWVDACKTGKTSGGDFSYAGPISEAFNLAAIALRTGKRLQWDAASMKITNVADANKYLYREYRQGWEL